MSRLDELIEELCPDGVEYSKLGSICNLITTGKLNANAMVENGKYPFFTCDANPYRINEYAFDTTAIIISGNGSQVGHINFYKGKFNAYQRTYVLSEFNNIDVKYLLHYLKGNLKNYIILHSKKGSVPYITMPMLKNFSVPLPPMPVQQEIVRILDNFTELTTELTEQLKAEIEARKKQYECYRDRLLSQEELNKLCPDGVEYKYLWEVTIWDKKFNAVERYKQKKVYTYPYMLASNLFELEKEEGNVYLLSTGEKTGWTTEDLAGNNLCEGEVVTIPWGKSRPVKDVIKYYKGKFVTADNRIVTSADTKILSNKYLYYWLLSQGEVIDTFYRGSGIKHPSMKDVLDMQIPLPPLTIQQEIVRILDNFTESITELTAKLETELEARQKQYEYYRDKLLSFKEVSS